jgi:3-oxoacyl-[acyl-carrier protein] reductase
MSHRNLDRRSGDKRMKKLEGKVALVTGAARGIGAAIAERLAADGASVVINYAHSGDEANAVAARINAKGGTATVIEADVSDPGQAKALIDATVDAFGRLDILVNNAGTIIHAPIAGVDETQIRSQFALNVDGPLFATQAAAPRFSTDGGRVINISSVVATRALAGTSVYSATKSALDALTRVWAAELGPRGVTVNAVAPGPVDTDMMKRTGISDEVREFMIARTPLGRIGTPADIADAVAFLASPDARWITGQILETSGGINP